MRLKKEISEFIKTTVKKRLMGAEVYLFGSRVYNDQKGGDIDILVIGDRRLSGQEKRDIKITFQKRFGEQRIDVVSFASTESSNFKDLILQEANRL
jgi:predicted nucleotidyltransferase